MNNILDVILYNQVYSKAALLLTSASVFILLTF